MQLNQIAHSLAAPKAIALYLKAKNIATSPQAKTVYRVTRVSLAIAGKALILAMLFTIALGMIARDGFERVRQWCDRFVENCQSDANLIPDPRTIFSHAVDRLMFWGERQIDRASGRIQLTVMEVANQAFRIKQRLNNAQTALLH